MESIMQNPLKTLLDESYAKVSYNKQYDIGIIIWKSRCTSAEYRNTFQSLMDYQQQGDTGVSYFLSDIRNQGVVGPEDRKWFETVSLTTAKKHGLKRATTVISGNIFKQYYVNVILSTAKNFGFPFKVFTEWNDAVKWVLDDETASINPEDYN